MYIYHTPEWAIVLLKTILQSASVKHLKHLCKVEYTNALWAIIPESCIIWIQYTASVENDLINIFQNQVPFFP